MSRFALAAVAAAAFLFPALAAPDRAAAQDANGAFGVMPIGEKGARAGNQCWTDTSGGGYWGYWAPCASAASNGRAAKR